MAGVLALFEDPYTAQINVEHLERAIKLTKYFLNEALRLLDMTVEDKELILAKALLDWMRQKRKEEGRDSFSLQEVYQKGGPRGVRKKKAAIMVLRTLVDHGFLVQMPENKWMLKDAG